MYNEYMCLCLSSLKLEPITVVPEEAAIRPRTVSLDEESQIQEESFRTIDGLLEFLQQHRGIKECSSSSPILKRLQMVMNEF